ncbi:SurA N-terminal domain-containing protein [Ancylobacter sp. 6x-1]|uniref:Parvulin-like PPIase n=1 Tax=Ancylobacter crimeensis TaxID=2579147 RepID=A0ABT0DCF4_9HYPH|nr:peptidylprolyl isomerase [Ancylobacter crimeensis]MCK0197646.1 SurA N-terminal domain-containing protein [Ancylobacter crimeensis]
MLQTLRKSASGFIAKILMALLIVSFGIWGIADVFRGFGGQTLAQVGSTEITIPEFRNLYQQRVQQISQQIKRGITPDMARSFGLPDQVLNERLAEASLDERARKLGLALSDEEMARRISENPAFRGPSGTFDPNYFNQVLRSNGYTEARFVEAERRLALRQQLIESLGGGFEVPQAMRDAFRRYETEERTVSYVVLEPAALDTIASPTDEQLKSFFDARKAAFRSPEFRNVAVLALTPDALAASVQVSDTDLKAAYQANLARFGTPEKRVVQQVVFPNADEAKAAADKIAGGATFADIVSARQLTPGDVDLGNVARDAIFDKAVADAAFGLPQGGTSGVVNGRFGPVIVHVETITAGTTQPFQDVAAKLLTDLQKQRAQQQLADMHDKVEDELAGGAKLPEAAQKLGLQLIQLNTDSAGKTPDGTPIEEIPSRSDVLRGAFAADVGASNDPLTLPNNGGYVWYEVENITPARDRTFDEAKAQALERFKEDEASKQLDARLEALKKAIADGTPFDKAATDAGLQVKVAAGLRRGRANDGGIPQGALNAVFETAQGQVGSAPTDVGDGRILFEVTKAVIPASMGEDEQVLATIRQRMQEDLMTAYLVQLQSDLGAKVNRAALDAIVGGGTATN